MSSTGGSKYRWAMMSYPAEYRDSVGDELVDTANALAGKRWSLRQSLGLLAGGLRIREQFAHNGDWRLAAASGFGIALLVVHLAAAISLTLLTTGLISFGFDFIVINEFPLAGFAVISVLIVLLLTRSTGTRTLVAVAALYIGLSVAVSLSGTHVSFSGLVLPLGILWFIGRYGDGEAVLSKSFVLALGVLLVGFAFAVNDPLAAFVVRFVLILLGIGLIRVRPSLAFAAASAIALNPFGIGALSLENGFFFAIAAVVSGIAYRAVRTAQPAT